MVRAGFMPIIGDGENAKSIVPIEDVVAAVLTVVRDSASTNGEIYNVAGDEALPMRTIASIIADELHVRLRMVRLPRLPFVLAGRVLDVPARWLPLPDIAQLAETYASSSVISDWKLRQLPSWSRQTSTVAALRATARETADP
jgi:nucleoside-diphosphate-sugar epimerase